MPGTKAGGQRAARTNKARHGDDFFKNIGHEGGKKSCKKGFAKMPKDKVKEAGSKGGKRSVRGKLDPLKKKNIAKPELTIQDLGVLKALLMTIERFLTVDLRWHPLENRKKNREFKKLYNLLDSGNWTAFMQIVGKDEGAKGWAVLKASTEMVMSMTRDKLEGMSEEQIETGLMSRYSIPRIAKAYEWVNGRSFKTNEKLHRGYVDEQKDGLDYEVTK